MNASLQIWSCSELQLLSPAPYLHNPINFINSGNNLFPFASYITQGNPTLYRDWATGLMSEESWLDSQRAQTNPLPHAASNSKRNGWFSSGIKRTAREADPSNPFRAEVDEWHCNSTLPHAFKKCAETLLLSSFCLIVPCQNVTPFF